MDSATLEKAREAIETFDLDRREELLADKESELTRFLRRVGAYAESHRGTGTEMVDYTDWNGAVVGRGPESVLRAGIDPDATLSAEELAPLVDWGPNSRMIVASHPSASSALLRELAADQDSKLLGRVASHRNADDAVFEVLARSANANARCFAASDRRCAERLLELLCKDPRPTVRLRAFSNPNLTPAKRYLDPPPGDVELRRVFAAHPKAPADVLDSLAADADVAVRRAIAANRNLPASVLTSLVSDPDLAVREAIAANPGTSSALLADLATDPEPSVRAAIPKNRNITAEIWASLVDDDNSLVRLAVAQSPAVPIETLSQLDMDSAVLVRSAARRNISDEVRRSNRHPSASIEKAPADSLPTSQVQPFTVEAVRRICPVARMAPEACPICAKIPKFAECQEKWGEVQKNTIPAEAKSLRRFLDFGPANGVDRIEKCPSCDGLYLVHQEYTYLVNGSEDELIYRRATIDAILELATSVVGLYKRPVTLRLNGEAWTVVEEAKP